MSLSNTAAPKYYGVITKEGLVLSHHGIKGQKWGVRRFQDNNGSLTKAGYERYYGNSRKKMDATDKKIQQYIKTGKAKVDNLKNYQVGELTTMITSTGEKFVSGLINGHDFDWQEVTNYDDIGLSSPSSVIKNNPNAHKFGYDEPISIAHREGQLTEKDMQECNIGFGKPGTTQNCAKCSAALEMRLRGYGISAGRQSYPSSVDSQSLWFKDAKRVDYETDFAEEALKSYGSMTSGTLSIQFPNGNGGHAMHWTNDKYGKFSIQDGQNGRTFSSISEMMDVYGADRSAGVTTFRLDNCEPNWDAFEQDSVIRRASTASKVKNRFSGKVVDTW